MHWIVASLLSAFFFGCYDLFTKRAVSGNAVVPVLFFSTVTGAAVWIVLMAGQAIGTHAWPAGLTVTPLTTWQHFQIAGKSAIITGSWTCTFLAFEKLPVSLAAPIRTLTPIWTLLGAVVLLAERPAWAQWFGIAITLGSCVALSWVGRLEGIDVRRNRGFWLMVGGTLFAGGGGLYDKYLFGVAHFSVPNVQAWFSVYLAVFSLPLALGWQRGLWMRGESFRWRWSIPLTAVALLVADYLYFSALSDPQGLVSMVSTLRRTSTLVAFGGGLLFFAERNGWQKLPAVLGVLVGVGLIILGK